MIVENQRQLTDAVVAVMERTPDPRLREIMVALVKHLHAFVRETRLTEPEWQTAVASVIALGQQTHATHSEAVLMAGSLGLSQLICLLNNGDSGESETAANLLGPFWRMHSPPTPNGGSLLRSPTPGPTLFVDAIVVDKTGAPIAGAEVDVWHSSPVGLYEQQDPEQAEMNLRGKFTTEANGRFWFRSVKPAGYPIPVNGVVGDLLRAQGRQHFRPAHLHTLIFKPGYKTLVSQIYAPDDPYLDRDPQFGVTRALIGDYIKHDEPHPTAPDVTAPWFTLDYRFVMEPGDARLPRAPIR